jgi:hypothetical protein
MNLLLLDVMEEILSLCGGGVAVLIIWGCGKWWRNTDRVVGWARDAFWVVLVTYFI